MTDVKNNTKQAEPEGEETFVFNEAGYVAELIRAGLEPKMAVEVAANTTRIKREEFDKDRAARRAAPAKEVVLPYVVPVTVPVKKSTDTKPKPKKIEPLGGVEITREEMRTNKARPQAVIDAENQLTDDIFSTNFFQAKMPEPAKKPEKAKDAIITRPIAVYDYRTGELPQRMRDLIETHLAIEAEDAKSAGTLGFMTRSLAIATLPHRRLDDFRFIRRNGDFTLTMMTAHPEGLPFGTIPRLLLTWVCTEIAQKKERVLHLGDNLAAYLQELGLNNSGGKRGDITRLKHSMTTLFSSVISCHYDGREAFALNNVLLADSVKWWTPQKEEDAGKWQSSVTLSEAFFQECVDHKLPFDMRAIKPLRSSPLALDIYLWLTHRMSYLSRRTTIPWAALAGQFGAGYAMNDQGLRDFRRAFLRELKHVLIVYPAAKCAAGKNGLVLYPSPTHIAPASQPKQPSLPFGN